MILSGLVEFLRARLDEDEQWALACNRPYEYADEGAKAPSAGVHWQWVTGENWEPVTPDPVTMEVVEGTDGSWSANLSTVEEWPVSSRVGGEVIRVSSMPRTYANAVEEMDPAAAGHIARHDPARVLAEVDAKRRIVDECDYWQRKVEAGEDYPALADRFEVAMSTLRLLALPYADHPGYNESWKP